MTTRVSFDYNDLDDFVRMIKSGFKYFLVRKSMKSSDIPDWKFDIISMERPIITVSLDKMNMEYLTQGYSIYLSNKKNREKKIGKEYIPKKDLFIYSVIS